MKTAVKLHDDALLVDASKSAAKRAPVKPVRLPVFRGRGGMLPGLDGLSNKAMLGAADRDRLMPKAQFTQPKG
jgi:hypothetical protein